MHQDEFLRTATQTNIIHTYIETMELKRNSLFVLLIVDRFASNRFGFQWQYIQKETNWCAATTSTIRPEVKCLVHINTICVCIRSVRSIRWKDGIRSSFVYVLWFFGCGRCRDNCFFFHLNQFLKEICKNLPCHHILNHIFFNFFFTFAENGQTLSIYRSSCQNRPNFLPENKTAAWSIEKKIAKYHFSLCPESHFSSTNVYIYI